MIFPDSRKNANVHKGDVSGTEFEENYSGIVFLELELVREVDLSFKIQAYISFDKNQYAVVTQLASYKRRRSSKATVY